MWIAHPRSLQVSKTFTTAETMLNARTVRQWITESLGKDAVARQALTLRVIRACEFMIGHMLPSVVTFRSGARSLVPCRPPTADLRCTEHQLLAALHLGVHLL